MNGHSRFSSRVNVALGTIGAWVVLRRRRPDSLGPLLIAAIAPLPGDLFLIECLHAMATRARWSPEGFWSLMPIGLSQVPCAESMAQALSAERDGRLGTCDDIASAIAAPLRCLHLNDRGIT